VSSSAAGSSLARSPSVRADVMGSVSAGGTPVHEAGGSAAGLAAVRTTMRVFLASAADRTACLALRREVFIDEQRVPEDLELDGEDDACSHFLAVADDGAPAGTARLRIVGDKAKAQRVAVRRAWRRQGVGAALMGALEDEARARGARTITLSSQTHAIPFYERLGYVAHGDLYDDAGIPHRDMTKPLQPATR
jgi:predicted GNAT family N-acyltransferase